MKRLYIIALAVMAGAVFNTVDAAAKDRNRTLNDNEQTAGVKLVTAADSLSYAAGMVRTEGLVPYLKQSFGVDTAYMADFIKGYEDAMAKGFDDRTKAYNAGLQIAQMVSERMLPFLKEEFAGRTDSVDEAMFNRGFVSSLRNDMSVMADSVAKKYFETAFRQAVDERNAATRKAGEDFLAANAKKEGVVTLPSGLQYKVLVKGTGAVPAASDEVTVKYEGHMIDGTEFDSSYKRGDGTAKFRPDQVIKGWKEALTMMPAGSKWELYIPYSLAYGERQAGKIKPYSALIFTVELVSVEAHEAGKDKPAKAQPKTIPATKIRPAVKK